jgi:hypothetical protein
MHLNLSDLEVTGIPLSEMLNVQHGYSDDKEAKSAFFRAVQPGEIFKTAICVLRIEKIFPASSEKNCINFYALANFRDNLIKEKRVQGRVYFDD